MSTLLHVLGLLLLFAGCFAALCTLVIGLPGTFIIVGLALLYAWATDFETVQWSTIGWLTLMAGAGEGIEFASSGAAAAGSRPSRRVTISALVGALVGGVIGTPLLFGVGSLIGALLGAFAGAALAVRSEGGSLNESVAIGFAALKGRLLGFVVKIAIAAAMLIVVVAAAI